MAYAPSSTTFSRNPPLNTYVRSTIAGRTGRMSSGKKGKLGAYAMKRVAASAHLPTPGLFESAKRQTIDPTTVWTAVSSPGGSTGYSFLHLSGVGCALWANSGEGSAQ